MMKTTAVCLCLTAALVSGAEITGVWPQPKSSDAGATTGLRIDATNFAFKYESAASPTLAAAFERYKALMFPHAVAAADLRLAPGGAAALSEVLVTVAEVDESHPQLETDESYSMQIGDDGSAKLDAATIYGAMHGLETLSQLVVFDFETQAYTLGAGTPISIDDAPRFPHRGLMIDTARHFETLAAIRSMVDSLPYAKVNVLHWHMVDSQSYPFQSKTYPKLWDGAYSDQERYTQADIAAVVEYARLRGVRVMVEFDMPGHAGSWCKGNPEVCPSASCREPLNVAADATWKLIESVLGECTGGKASAPGKPSGLFPDNFLHLGGDEVNTNCWTKTPSVKSWLDARNYTADQGYAYFVNRTAAIALSQGRRPVQWVEVFDHFGSSLPKEVIVHVWKDKSTLVPVVEAGYDALINNSPGSDSWYLDHLNIKWDACYGNEPCSAITDDKLCAKHVLGGQGEMWGETVDTSDFEQTVWPKMAAIAERLWSPRAVNNATAAQPRLEQFRCLLNRRGIRSAPVNNANARSAPPGPGSCTVQRR